LFEDEDDRATALLTKDRWGFVYEVCKRESFGFLEETKCLRNN